MTSSLLYFTQTPTNYNIDNIDIIIPRKYKMENISSKRTVQFRFNIHSDAPVEYFIRWKYVLKELCESDLYRDEILHMWRYHMKLTSNKLLPNLNRCEGGLGGDNNQTDKQIRFQEDYGMVSIPRDTFIIHICASWDEENTWSLKELLDLKQAFVKVLNLKVEGQCCEGIIAII